MGEERTKALREASGQVVYTDALTSFLYELMRDHLPAGKVEEMVAGVLSEPEERLFTNGWLANYANHLAELLTNDKVNKLKNAISKAFGEEVKRETKDVRPSFKTDEEQVKERTDDVAKILTTMVSAGQLDPKEAEEIRKEMLEFEKENATPPPEIVPDPIDKTQ